MKKYELKTISDLVRIPPDRLSEAIKEIEGVIIGYHLQIAQAGGIPNPDDFQGFTWVDDGEGNLDYQVVGEDEPFFQIKLKERKP